MMFPTVDLVRIVLTLMALDLALVGRRLGLRRAVETGLVLVGAGCLTGLLYPLFGNASLTGLAILSGLLGLVIGFTPTERITEFRARFHEKRPGIENWGLLCYTVVLLLGTAEILSRVFSSDVIADQVKPIVTVFLEGEEDYRGFHMMGDRRHVPDPDLLWVPSPRPPFNEQGFRGPLLDVPKPEGFFRILVYGDSNAEGIEQAPSWPENLQEYLNNVRSRTDPRYQVANAGVSGYSSHQGLLRFRREVNVYDPDLVFVSFGWNDCARAAGIPDKDYRPPSTIVVAFKRFLFKYRFFVLLTQTLTGPIEDRAPYLDEKSSRQETRRVSVADYFENLASFQEEGRKREIRTVFLTRPHRPESAYEEDYTKRVIRDVQVYNAALKKFAEQSRAEYVDVEELFAEGSPEHFMDSCHFTEPGRRQMARILRDYLRRPPTDLDGTEGQDPDTAKG